MTRKILIAGFLIIFIFYGAYFTPLENSFLTRFVFALNQTEMISLDLKGMDIQDVMKILAQKSGFNIVLDNDVKGIVTLYIKDVSVMDALDIIVTTNNLAYEQSGLVIRVMTDREYEIIHGKKFRDKTRTEIVKLNYVVASEVTKVLAQAKTNVGRVIPDDSSNTIVMIEIPEHIERMKEIISEMDILLITEIFPLEYAKVELLKDKFEQVLSKGIGTIKFDERTNKLVVKDTPQKIEEIRRIIKAFDEKNREVIIDANIIQVTLSDKYSYGIDWTDIANLGDIKITADTNLNTGLSNVTPSTITVATTGGKYSTILSLLKTYGKTNVLSRPRITVLDKQEAKILVGAKEAYVTSEVTTTVGGTYHTTDNVQFVDVGVNLSVVPQINREGYITLKIKPAVSSSDATKTVTLKNPDGSTRTIVPYVTTSEAETTVVVKDNTTIIIGGLMKDTIVDHTEKVPFFGDIPLLGKLFTAKGKTKEKTELVIFLTPHIIEGDRTMEEIRTSMDEWEKKIKADEAGDFSRPSEARTQVKKPAVKQKLEPVKAQEKNQWSRLFGAKPKKASKPVIEPPKKKESASPNMVIKTPYEEYYLKIREDINTIARQQDVSGLKGEVELQFTLDKNGFLTNGPIVLNNPDLKLVRSAVNCVKKAMPFPAFPKNLKKEEAEFNVVVRYK